MSDNESVVSLPEGHAVHNGCEDLESELESEVELPSHCCGLACMEFVGSTGGITGTSRSEHTAKVYDVVKQKVASGVYMVQGRKICRQAFLEFCHMKGQKLDKLANPPCIDWL